MTEFEMVEALFRGLINSEFVDFPTLGTSINAPTDQGVYIIYDKRGKVLHVGRTPRGARGLKQRLANHLHGKSSFTEHYLENDGSRLRDGCGFRCLVVPDVRHRALLEAYATGRLCPAHLGLGQGELSET